MKNFRLSKSLGVFWGTMMIVISIGYGFVYLLGTSLGKALGSTLDTAAEHKFTLFILAIICILGVMIGAGSFKLQIKGWRIFYIGFCLAIGLSLFITFLFSVGALGTKYEMMILFMSVVSFLLAYLVKKEI